MTDITGIAVAVALWLGLRSIGLGLTALGLGISAVGKGLIMRETPK